MTAARNPNHVLTGQGDITEIKDRIHMLRKQRNMTLDEVGAAVGVGKSTVRKWESGLIKNMRRDKIQKLAQALGTTPAYLMGWDEKPESNNNVAASGDTTALNRETEGLFYGIVAQLNKLSPARLQKAKD